MIRISKTRKYVLFANNRVATEYNKIYTKNITTIFSAYTNL